MYVIPERNAVIIPNFEEGKKYTIFPYRLETFQYLARYSINLPSMIRHDYEFKSRFPSAMGHQIETTDFCVQHPRGCVFSQIGTGKTLPVLWAADYLMRIGKCKKVLISSTLSTLDTVWANEIFKSFPGRTYAVIYGSKERRLKQLARDVDFYIINHEGLAVLSDWEFKNDKKKLLSTHFDDRDDITHIVVDECAMFRNQKIDRYKVLKHITATRPNLWMISGSPMPKAPTDIWAQAKLIDPKLFPRSFTQFRDRVMIQLTQFKWVPRKGWEKTIYEALKNYCIRFERKDCLDLPPVVIKKRKVEMSPGQKKAYNDMKAKFCIELKGGKITAANEGVKLNKLLQISCGVVYDGEGVPVVLDIKKKLADLDLLLEMAGTKVIIYTPFKYIGKLLQQHVLKTGSCELINGDVSKHKRDKIFYRLQNGNLDYIVAHPQCMAHGIDMTRSHVIIWWSPIDNWEYYEQASERITRKGQTLTQIIIHMSCSATEDGIYARNKNKQSMQGLLLELIKR